MDVSARITELRTKRGMTVNKLANESGVSQSFLREIELGLKRPTVETLSTLCSTLRVSMKDFFDDGAFTEQDELDKVLFRLTPEQRKKLADFINTMYLK